MGILGRCVFCEQKTEEKEGGHFCCVWHREVFARVNSAIAEVQKTYAKKAELRITLLENELETLHRKYAEALRGLRNSQVGDLSSEGYMQRSPR